MAKALINDIDITNIRKLFLNQNPFNHVVIDNFWKKDIAEQLQKEIVSFSSDNNNVSVYDSPLEKKITCNHYDKFSKFTYQAFTYLNSNAFIDMIKKITDIGKIISALNEASIEILDMETVDQDLENIFLKLTGKV